jgi:predicted outer membrane lipoprotein
MHGSSQICGDRIALIVVLQREHQRAVLIFDWVKGLLLGVIFGVLRAYTLSKINA